MDITLERILSLIPRKPDGSYVHGAKKEFADSLNMAHNLVTMWEKGQSTSYRNKVHEISAKYNVSVEWLKGETDEKQKGPAPEVGDGLTDTQREAWALLQTMSDEQLRQFIRIAKAIAEE